MRNNAIFVLAFLMLSSFVLAQAPPSPVVPDVSAPNTLTLYSNGWNMISSPVGALLDVETISATCPQMQTLWHFNGSTQKWHYSKGYYNGASPVTQLYPDKGYWVLMGKNESNKCVVKVTGPAKPSAATITLYKGWNMISNPISGVFWSNNISDVCGTAVNLNKVPVWHFNGSTQKWQNSTSGDASSPKIESLGGREGYYVYATAGCTIQFQDGAVVNKGSTTTDTTTTPPESVKPCRTQCRLAERLGSVFGISSTASAETCEMSRGNETFYIFNMTFSGGVDVAVAAKTNNDMDLYVYNSSDGASHGSVCGTVKCSSSKSGTAIDSCSFEAVKGENYYLRIKNYDSSGYADKGVAVVSLGKKSSGEPVD